MKTSLWVVVVAVVGIVGFLLGYSFSSYSGVRAVTMVRAAEGEPKEESHPGAQQHEQQPAAGYGTPSTAGEQQHGASPGYGAPASPSTTPHKRAPAKAAPVTAGY